MCRPLSEILPIDSSVSNGCRSAIKCLLVRLVENAFDKAGKKCPSQRLDKVPRTRLDKNAFPKAGRITHHKAGRIAYHKAGRSAHRNAGRRVEFKLKILTYLISGSLPAPSVGFALRSSIAVICPFFDFDDSASRTTSRRFKKPSTVGGPHLINAVHKVATRYGSVLGEHF